MANPEGHWFDRSTMRFFKTKLPRTAYRSAKGNYFFVTHERSPMGRGGYTVRMYENGTIHTIGEFQGYPFKDTARIDAKRFCNAEVKP